jgi:hypothetical protein
MRRAIIALVGAAALTLTGLTLGPALRAAALGEAQVTLSCSDGTSVTLVVDKDTLSSLTAAVQGMIDYPAGLSCTLIQNLLTAPFGGIALASTENTFVVIGGRWEVDCSIITGEPFETFVAGGSRSAKLMVDTQRLSMQTGTTCADPAGCIFVNIAVNAHFTGEGTVQGTLNETIPENQSCPTSTGPLAIGPSHFTSKPVCLDVIGSTAFVNSRVTQTSGQPFPRGGGAFGLNTDPPDFVQFGFQDDGNPPQPIDTLDGPPHIASISPTPPTEGTCPGPDPSRFMSNGNISVHP